MASLQVQRSVVFATLPCLATLLAGCGGGGDSGPEPAPTPSPAPNYTPSETLPNKWSVCAWRQDNDTMRVEKAGCDDEHRQLIMESVSVLSPAGIPLTLLGPCDILIQGFLESECGEGFTVTHHNETSATCMIERREGTRLVNTEVGSTFCDSVDWYSVINQTWISQTWYDYNKDCDFAIESWKQEQENTHPGSCQESAVVVSV